MSRDRTARDDRVAGTEEEQVAVAERGRPRDPNNDAAILDAALDLLIERGPAGASIEAIARRAGVAKLTVYRRGRDKQELLTAALEHGRGADEDDAPPASLEAVIASMSELLGRHRFRLLMARVIGASVDYPQLVETYRRHHLQPRLAALTDLARDAVEAGSFPAGTDPAAVRDVIAGAVGLALLEVEPMTAAQVEQRIRRTLTHLGYRPSAPGELDDPLPPDRPDPAPDR